jgi:hypothetical protein
MLATCFHAGFLLGLVFDPEDGGDMLMRNVGCLSTDYTALYPRKQNSSPLSLFSSVINDTSSTTYVTWPRICDWWFRGNADGSNIGPFKYYPRICSGTEQDYKKRSVMMVSLRPIFEHGTFVIWEVNPKPWCWVFVFRTRSRTAICKIITAILWH